MVSGGDRLEPDQVLYGSQWLYASTSIVQFWLQPAAVALVVFVFGYKWEVSGGEQVGESCA